MNETGSEAASFLIPLENVTLRVRKEDFGCIVFDSNDIYVEGNKTVYEVLKFLQQNLPQHEVATQLANKYRLPAAFIKKDIQELFLKFKSLGWE